MPEHTNQPATSRQREVVFLRSTSSRTIFEQQLGRGLRRAPGKDKVTVLDFVANVERINFVRDLGHTISKLRDKLKTPVGSGERLTHNGLEFEHPLFGISNFEFEDQTIEILDRYETLAGRTYLTPEIVKAAYEELRSVSKVAEKFGVTSTAIYKQLKKAGVNTSGHLGHMLPIEIIAETYYRCGSARQASQELGISDSTIRERLRKAGYKLLQQNVALYTDQEIIEALERNDHKYRATARELGVDRGVINRVLQRTNYQVPERQTAGISKYILDNVYADCKGDITQMVEQIGEGWAEVYRALDKHGYLDNPPRPITSAVAAAAYYKFGSTVQAGKLLHVSATLIRKKSKGAKYIPRYGRKRERIMV